MCRRLLRLLVVCLAALAVLPLWPAAAFGHAAFVGSMPEPGARLAASPRRLALSFTEPLNRRLSTVRLVAVDGGRRVAAPVRAVSARRLELVPATGLARGAYRVEWRTVSTEDGHALEGSFSFGIRAAAFGGSEHSVQQSPLARTGWLRVTMRGALYVVRALPGRRAAVAADHAPAGVAGAGRPQGGAGGRAGARAARPAYGSGRVARGARGGRRHAR